MNTNYAHCETNGENNKINVIGNSIIDSKGINDELILNGDDIRFRAKYGSSITCVGRKKRWLSMMNVYYLTIGIDTFTETSNLAILICNTIENL